MLERDGRNVRVAELLTGQYTAVAGDHFAVGVDQYWDIEPERVDAARDLADLPGRMRARVLGIELELGDQAIDHLNPSRGFVNDSHSSLKFRS
jgi:hypothetical protein